MPPPANKTRKKKPKLLITNLEGALNPASYDPVTQHLPGGGATLTGLLPVTVKKEKTVRELTYTTEFPVPEFALLREVEGAGPTEEGRKITSPRDGFNFFLGQEVMLKILQCTNHNIAYYLQSVKDARQRESNYDKTGQVYNESDVESDVDVTGLEDHQDPDQNCVETDSDRVSETEEDQFRADSTQLEVEDGTGSGNVDPEFQKFLRSLDSETVSPTEEEKKLVRYISDWKSWNWNSPKEFNYVTLDELYAFIGLMYYRGMLQHNNSDVDRLFGGKDNIAMFGATMTKMRFKFILANLSFDPASSLIDQKKKQGNDKFGIFRNVFEYANMRFCQAMVPEKFLTVEEYFYILRTQDKLGLKYIPVDINNARGMLFKTINGVDTQYTYRAHVFTTAPAEPPNKYFQRSPELEVQFMVQEIENQHSLAGRNLTTGRTYTSITLAEWLRDKKEITLVGELAPSTPGFPDELHQVSTDLFSSTVYHEPHTNIHLVSYVVPSKCPDSCKQKLRNQTFITTTNPITGTSKDKKRKPAIAQLYEYTKGRPEANKKSPPTYTCKPKCIKWTISGFSFILDLIRMNCAIIVGLNTNKKLNGCDFGYELARSLILPHLYNRQIVGLNYITLTKMYQVTHDKKFLHAGSVNDVPDSTVLQKFDKTGKGAKRRCFHCEESAKGPGYQSKRAKLQKIMSRCQECGAPSCISKHLLNICTTCYTPPGISETQRTGESPVLPSGECGE